MTQDTTTATATRSLRVQLIHPPQRIAPANLVSSVAIPPLGLAYLVAAIEREGHQVSVIDGVGAALGQVHTVDGREFHGLGFDEIVDRVDPGADILGVSIMFTSSWPALRELIRQIKQRYPHKTLIVGGEHASALPELILRQSGADYVAVGEGEVTLIEFCARVAARRDPRDVDGLVFRLGDHVHHNAPRERIRDVDAIPLPAWRHFDIPAYMRYGQPHGSADGKSMPMLATRGCPYRCTFCSAHSMWGVAWRPRDPVAVVDEMELYIKQYGADDFHFEDLTAVVRKRWILALADEIQRRGLKVSWQLPSGTRSEAIDAETARAMYASGCRQFTFALESGAPEILKRIRKRMDLDKAFVAAKDAMAAGIRVQGCFIYGFPGETYRHIWQTFRTIVRCAVVGFHEVTICSLQPLPRTELFHELHQAEKIELTDRYFDSIFGYLGIWTQRSWNPRMWSVTLRLLILFSYVSFFTVSFALRPRRAWALIKGLLGRRSGGKFAKIVKGMVRRPSRYGSLQHAPG